MDRLKITVETAGHKASQDDPEGTAGREDVIVFEDFETMDRVLSEANLEILEAIVTYRPDSMRETATLVDRDIKDVHHNLTELESFGLIEFEQVGRAKRPVAGFDAIEIEVPFLPENGPPLLESDV